MVNTLMTLEADGAESLEQMVLSLLSHPIPPSNNEGLGQGGGGHLALI